MAINKQRPKNDCLRKKNLENRAIKEYLSEMINNAVATSVYPGIAMAKTILIVDDEQDILDLLTFNLKREGFETLTAADGDTALDAGPVRLDPIWSFSM